MSWRDDNVNNASNAVAPSRSARVVTPNNGADLDRITKGLYVGGAGDVEVILVEDAAQLVFTGVPAGTILPLQVRRVRAANTTATNIIALY